MPDEINGFKIISESLTNPDTMFDLVYKWKYNFSLIGTDFVRFSKNKATEEEVEALEIDDKFVTPKTLKKALKITDIDNNTGTTNSNSAIEAPNAYDGTPSTPQQLRSSSFVIPLIPLVDKKIKGRTTYSFCDGRLTVAERICVNQFSYCNFTLQKKAGKQKAYYKVDVYQDAEKTELKLCTFIYKNDTWVGIAVNNKSEKDLIFNMQYRGSEKEQPPIMYKCFKPTLLTPEGQIIASSITMFENSNAFITSTATVPEDDIISKTFIAMLINKYYG